MSTPERHPSFGALTLHHSSGHRHLYGSDVPVATALTLTLYASQRSEHQGQLQHEKTGKPLARIQMSTVQWAELISTRDSAAGVPCTVTSLNGEAVEEYPEPADTHIGRMQTEMKRHLDAAFSEVSAAQAELRHLTGLGKSVKSSDLAAVSARMSAAVASLREHIPFLTELFQETTEEITAAAKAEVITFLTNNRALGTPATHIPPFLLPTSPASED